MTLSEKEVRRARIYADMRAMAEMASSPKQLKQLRELLKDVAPDDRPDAFEAVKQAMADADNTYGAK